MAEAAHCSGALLCQCGEPLEVRCRHGHEPEPFRVEGSADRAARDTKSPRGERTPPSDGRHRPRGPWKAARDRVCACGATFTPTGPRDSRCPGCKAVTH